MFRNQVRPISAVLLTLCFAGAWINIAQAEPRRYALVVGVREYPASEKLDKLPFAETDATKLAEVLKKTGYDVTLMTQTASKGEGGERFAPTATFLRREFALLAKTPGLKGEDCVLLTLAGHGIQLPSKNNPKQTAYYFCPADAQIDSLEFLEDVADKHNLIPVDEFFETLKTCKAGVRLLIVDACRNDPTKSNSFRTVNSITRPPINSPPGGIAALFSCSANEKAVEDSELKHGVFTHYLIEALSGLADGDKNGELSIAEIDTYVGSRTFDFVRKKYGRQQLPELSGSIQGWAALASLSPTGPSPVPVTTMKPVTLPPPAQKPTLQKLTVGTQAGELWDKNSLATKFRWCPPGTFQMGSPAREPNRGVDENQVTVRLTKGFWLGQHEVTQAEWEETMGSKPWLSKSNVKEGGSYPATHICWEDASEFCAKLTAKGHTEGWLSKDWQVDLPTEAQWEYACRAGTESVYAFGESSADLSEHGWFKENAVDVEEMYAHQVGLKKPNEWNLYDMHGNLREWCCDWYLMQLPGGTDPNVQVQATNRVLRSSRWNNLAENCRCAHRSKGVPGERFSDIGFRVALIPTASR